MPRANRFRHQTYTAAPPTSPHQQLRPNGHPTVGSDEFCRRMDEVGRKLSEAGVAAVYLVHGTFVGTDALGMLAGLSRVLPQAGRVLRRTIKRLVDKITAGVGNYSSRYAQLFEASLNDPRRPFIPVRRFHWSSQNNHIGRADGAVRLVDELASLQLEPQQRVLLWGHSHAGNVFALTTNLLGSGSEAVDAFFKAAEIYYRWPLLGCVDMPLWRRVRDLLGQRCSPIFDLPLDIVTFGTPVRYGWDSDGYSRLLHFVNHRPAGGLPGYRAAFPPRIAEIINAAGGDYVQQLGIAGTNLAPSRFAWRSRLADKRLQNLLQADVAPSRLLERLQAGTIVHDEGTTLLVDYGPLAGGVAAQLAGHAVYTSRQWMLFHAEQVVQRF